MGLYKSAYLFENGVVEFWVDSHHNRWDSRIFTYEQALENSKHLLFQAMEWNCLNYIKDGMRIEMPEPNPENGVKEYKQGNKIYRDTYVKGKLESSMHCFESGDRKTWYEDVYGSDGKNGWRMYYTRYKKLVLVHERIRDGENTIVRDFEKKSGRLLEEGEYFGDYYNMPESQRNDDCELYLKAIVKKFDEEGKVRCSYECDNEKGVMKKFDGKGALLIERKYENGVLEIKEFEKGKLVRERKGKYEFNDKGWREKILLKEFDGAGKLVREYDIDEDKGSTKIYEDGELVGKRSRRDGIGELTARELVAATKHYNIV